MYTPSCYHLDLYIQDASDDESDSFEDSSDGDGEGGDSNMVSASGMNYIMCSAQSPFCAAVLYNVQ